MELASVREGVNLTNTTKAISPYVLRQILKAFTTKEYLKEALKNIEIDPGMIDLSSYAKKTDLPTKTSQLTNDSDFVALINGLIPSSFLPSYVDDVIEYESKESFPNPGETGKIYIDLKTNITYRWGGTTYIEISRSLALGETADSAFRGDYGKIAYDHTFIKGNPHELKLSDLGITVTEKEINFLTGLSDNILIELSKKLDLTGGTITGYLKLSKAPVNKEDATNKLYVDQEINGISLKVTQNIKLIGDLKKSMDGITSTQGVMEDTLTKVEVATKGLLETTEDHTNQLSTINQSIDKVESTVKANSETITTLEATINLLELELEKDVMVVPINKNKKPIIDETFIIPYTVKFRGNVLDPENLIITGTNAGIVVEKGKGQLLVKVKASTAIPASTNTFIVEAQYTDAVLYKASKAFILTTVAQGENGTSGKDGVSVTSITNYYAVNSSNTSAPTSNWTVDRPDKDSGEYLWVKQLFSYSNSTTTWGTPYVVTGDKGEDIAIKSPTAPADTSKVWLDTSTGQLKQYVKKDSGEGSWVVINDYSGSTEALDNRLEELNKELTDKMKELDALIQKTEESTSSKITQTSKDLTVEFEKLQKSLTETSDKLVSFIETQKTYIRFSVDGILLGDVNSNYTLRIDNDTISILKGDQIISSWDQDIFRVKQLVIKEDKWNYYFTWMPRPNGSLSLRKVSD